MNLFIKNGRLLDPSQGLDEVRDLYVIDGRIASAQDATGQQFSDEETIDAQGCWVLPGLVDLSVRLKTRGTDPQQTSVHAEVQSALAGGITSVVLPPDTKPVLDELSFVEMLMNRNRLYGRLSNVFPLGAMTVGLQGNELTEMAALKKAGCIAFSHATQPLPDLSTLRSCMQYAATYGFCLWLMPREASLSHGVAGTGEVASRLGLKDIPEQAETIALQELFELQRSTGVSLHLCRLSSARSVELVAQAKKEGLPVTADVSINHVLLSDVDIGYFDANYRLMPPLRSVRDRDALVQGLANGIIDAICSDHTPIDSEHKFLPFGEAEPGAVGTELLLSLVCRWAEQSGTDILHALSKIISGPAGIINSSSPSADLQASLKPGAAADLVVYDPSEDWMVSQNTLQSASPHTPFAGYGLTGRVLRTFVGGKLSWQLK